MKSHHLSVIAVLLSLAFVLAMVPLTSHAQSANTLDIVLIPSSVSMDESSTASYQVRLNEEPTSSVNVSLSISNNEEISSDRFLLNFAGSNNVRTQTKILTFTTQNWNHRQTVSLASDVDQDFANETLFINHLITGGGYSVLKTLPVSITDTGNDEPAIVLSKSSITVQEGSINSSGDPNSAISGSVYTVELSKQPSENINVSVTSNNTETVSVTGGTSDLLVIDSVPSSSSTHLVLSFTPNDWDQAKTIVLRSPDDDDIENESITVTHSAEYASGKTSYIQDKELAVTVNDNDRNVSLIIVPSEQLVTGEGSRKSYNVRLSDRPTSDVTVEITSSDTSVLTVQNPTLRFTRSSWQRFQPVTVVTASDDDNYNENVVLTHNSQGGGYDLVDNVLLDVFVDDADLSNPELVITPSSNLVVEENTQANYTVRLSEQPTSNVVVSITSSNLSALTLQRSSLAFTRQSWSQEQTVIVTGRQDSDSSNEEVTITHNSRGGGYDQVDNVTLTAIVNDDEPTNPGLEITPSGRLIVHEGNSSFYNVRLTEKPGSSVWISLVRTGSSIYTNVSTLAFTKTNWDTFQTVKVTARNDVDNDNEEAVITHNSRGGGYDLVDNINLSVFVDDSGPENPNLVTNVSPLTVTDHEPFAYTLRLSERPIGTVTVSVTSNDTGVLKINSSTRTLTFNGDNWNIPQEIRATASDPNTVTETFSITHTARGGGYNGVKFSLSVEATDTDPANLVLSPSQEIIVDEGRNAYYYVSLSSQPISTVTVNITVRNNDANHIRLSRESLTFTRSNWKSGQSVRVYASPDDDANDIDTDSDLTIEHQASGGEYGSASEELMVRVNDDESKDISLIITPSRIGPITEGESLTYGVRLNTNPNITTINLDVSVPDDVASLVNITPPASSFDSSNWNETQNITIEALDDDDLDNERITISHKISAIGVVGLHGKDIQLTIEDDEPSNPAIIISKRLLLIKEGQTGTYTVKLSQRPSEPVTIAAEIFAEEDSEGNPTLRSLTSSDTFFTTDNWNVAQDLSVVTAADANGVSETWLINHTGRGGGYQHASAVEAKVIIQDDDPLNPEILPSVSSLNVREGETGSYRVKLSERPSDNVTVTLTSGDSSRVSFSPESLNFTTSNWRNAQTVQITVQQDDDSVSENISVTHSGSGGGYDTADANAIVQINLTDDDPTDPEIIFSESPRISVDDQSGTSSIVVEEAGDAVSYKVRLSQRPSGDVNVTLTQTLTQDQLSISTETLKFGVLNWSREQTVTLRALNDNVKNDLTSTITHRAKGGGYRDTSNNFLVKTLEVTLKNDDPQSPGINLSTSEIIMEEGQAHVYHVNLNLTEQPSRDDQGRVVVSLTSDNPSASIFPESLTFTRQNWNVGQPVQIFARHDSDNQQDTATITHSAAGAGYDSADNATLDVTINDDDPISPSLTLTKQLLTIDEGERESYSVELSERPSAEVTITITSNNPDVTVQSPTLTFTRLNWNHPQTVIVNAANDQGGIDDSANLTNNATGGGYSGQVEIVKVVVRDDEPSAPSLILSSFPTISINENGNASYQIKLSERPLSTVTVTIVTGNSDIVLNPKTLSFTPLNWSQSQQVDLSAQDDSGVDDEQINLTHSASGGGYDAVSATLTVNLIDDDSAGLRIVPISNFVVPEGGSAIYTVELKTLPKNSVRINLSANTEKVDFSTTTLDFTTLNWDVPQNVRVTASQDDDEADDDFVITHDSASQDSDYDGIDRVHLAAKINDDEVEDATLRINASSLRMNEHETLRYSVQLSKLPTGDVTVNIANGNISKISVQPASLDFTRSNWNESQDVTVTALADADGNDESVSITHYSNGGGYDRVRSELEVTVIDDDPEDPEIVTPSELNASEGQSETYSVRLNEKPNGNVNVTITIQDPSIARVDKSVLEFTRSNWNSPQIVRVTAEQDDDSQDGSVKILHTAIGGGFEAAEVAELSLSIEDDEPGAPSIVLDGSLTVVEGESEDYEVKLGEKPSGDVVVSLTVSGSSDVSVGVPSLTFTSSNWNVSQTVRVTAEHDNDNADGTAQIAHVANGGGYSGVQKTLDVDVEDDEPGAPSIVLDGSLTVVEGESEDYEVKLGEKPSGDVVVSLTVSGSSDVSVGVPSLTFTSSNWNVSQTVRVTAEHDNDNADGTAQIAHVANGGGYSGVQKTLDVDVEDDEPGAPSIVLDGSLTVVEGESEDYEVKLGEKPSGDVVVSLTVSGSSDVSVGVPSLTFTSSNWNVSQTVRVTVGQDEDNQDETAQIAHVANGGGYNSVQKTLDVDVKDDELKNPELIMNPSELTIVEGSSGTYSVKLREMPKGQVSVSITSNRGTVSLNPSDLQFNRSNWNQSQEIRVSASEDSDAINDVALLRHRLTGGGYDGITAKLMVNMIDSGGPQVTPDEEQIQPESQTVQGASIEASRNSLNIDEGEDKTYRVRLSEAPLDTVTVKIRSSKSEVDVDPRTLIFTTSDWNDYQEVDVSADQDDDTRDEDATITHVASGGGYDNAEEVEIDVEVDDDDTESEESPDEEQFSPSTSSLELPRFRSTSEIAAQTSSSWPRWNPGAAYQTNLEDRNVLISDISFNAFKSSVDPIAFIARLNSRPRSVGSNPPGVDSVYGFFEIALNDAARNTASGATVSFTVDEAWLNLRDFTAEGIQLWGWDEGSNSWRNFKIDSVRQTSEGLSLSSDISLRMPFFAITATSVEVEEEPAEEEPESRIVEVIELPPVAETAVQPEAEDQPSYFDHDFEFELSPVPILIVLALLVGGLVALILLLRL